MRAAGVPQRTPPTVPAARVAFIVLPYTVGVLGISGPEFLVIILVTVIVVGPQRLPEYTRKLTQAVRRLRVFLDDAKEQIAEEVGPELTDLDLSDLDPRNYDPRKIVRDALGEDLDAIRKDLANPIQSVAKDARDAASDAVKTEAASRSKKSLSRMIDDRAEQAREGRRAQTEADDSDAAMAVTAADAADAADAGDVATAADSASQPEAVATAADAGDVEDTADTADAASQPEAAEADVEPVEDKGDVKAAEDAGDAGDAGDAEDAGDAGDAELDAEPAETVEAVEAAEDDQGAGGAGGAGNAEGAGDTQPAEAPKPIPSSLVDEISEIEGDGEAIQPIRRARPVSPREIVRAANAAARTRAEAASAVIDI